MKRVHVVITALALMATAASQLAACGKPLDAGGGRLSEQPESSLRGAVTEIVDGREGGVVVGRIVDGRGEPLSGARVLLFKRRDQVIREFVEREGRRYRLLDRRPIEVEIGPGGDGRFRIDSVVPGRWEIVVVHPDLAPYGPSAFEVPEGGTVDLRSITLAPGGRLAGRVTDTDARPVEGARLEAGPVSRTTWYRDDPFPSARGASDAEGRFELTGLPLGEPVELIAEHSDHRGARIAAVELPLDRPLLVELSPGGRIFGRVVGLDGEPLERADVRAWAIHSSSPSVGTATTGADGGFEIKALATGTFNVQVEAPGYPRHEAGGVEVAEGERSGPLEVRLEAAEVSGRILAPDRTAAADVAVVVDYQRSVASLGPEPFTYSAGIHWRDRSQARTDSRGEFVIRGLKPGRATIVVEHESLGDAAAEIDLRAGVNPIELRLQTSGRIHGRVVDVHGSPVANAWVTLAPATKPARGWAGRARRFPLAQSPGQAVAGDGGFVFRRLARGEYRLQAAAPGLRQETPPVTVTLGETPLPSIELTLAPGEEIHGEIVGLTADTRQPTLISAQGPGGETRGAQVDEEGRYRLGGLGAGRWKITVFAPGGRLLNAVVDVVEGAGPYRLDFDLQSGLRLTGRVRAAGEPLAGASVGLRRLDGEHVTDATTEADGTFRVQGLAPGAYSLTVTEPGGVRLDRRRVELSSDRNLDLDLVTASLTGRLLDPAGSPVGGDGAVSLYRTGTEPDRFAGSAPIDSAGRFSLPLVAPGTYEVRASVGQRLARATVTLEGGRQRELDLRVDEGAQLVLVPSLAGGGRPDQLQILIMESDLLPVYSGAATLSANGEALFTGVPAGDWSIAAFADGTAMVSVDVTVPGPPIAVTLPPPTILEIEVPDLADAPYVPLVLTGSDGRVPAAGRSVPGTMLILGRSRIENLPPGAWTVRIESPDGRKYEGTAITTPDRPISLALD